jgi:uncharacterized protein involved in exopolysaccharide biosynthesis
MDEPTTSGDRSEFQQAVAQRRPGGSLAELWEFLRWNRKWWLLPLLAVMILLALLMALSTTAAAPFIYTFF